MVDIQDLPAPQQSARFNAGDADVIFRSTDNVMFNIHRKNLESTTGTFPPSTLSTQGQIVLLSESSATLELMFQYIYPMPQPDVSSLSFDTLAPLAEAAEKYEVFPAMLICKIHMRKFIPEHIQQVVGYAAKHGYNDIIDEAAPLLLDIPLQEALEQMPENLVIPWARYYGTWDRILRSARTFPMSSELLTLGNGKTHYVTKHEDWGSQTLQCQCNIDRTIRDVLMALREVGSLQNVVHVFAPMSASACETVAPHLKAWQESIEEGINALKPFITYL